MRISDWSSDVCSSDLQVWRLYAGRPAGGDAEGLRRLLLALIKDVRGILIVLARHLLQLRSAANLAADERLGLARLCADILAPLANRLGIWQEMGRAACRERVCQYV